MTTTVTLTAPEREAVQDGLAVDERTEIDAAMTSLLDEIATEIARVRHKQDAVPVEYESTLRALEVVEAVGRQGALRGPVASIVHLIEQVQDLAVKQARAHGATWREIGTVLNEDHRNLRNRYAGKGAA